MRVTKFQETCPQVDVDLSRSTEAGWTWSLTFRSPDIRQWQWGCSKSSCSYIISIFPSIFEYLYTFFFIFPILTVDDGRLSVLHNLFKMSLSHPDHSDNLLLLFHIYPRGFASNIFFIRWNRPTGVWEWYRVRSQSSWWSVSQIPLFESRRWYWIRHERRIIRYYESSIYHWSVLLSTSMIARV